MIEAISDKTHGNQLILEYHQSTWLNYGQPLWVSTLSCIPHPHMHLWKIWSHLTCHLNCLLSTFFTCNNILCCQSLYIYHCFVLLLQSYLKMKIWRRNYFDSFTGSVNSLLICLVSKDYHKPHITGVKFIPLSIQW